MPWPTSPLAPAPPYSETLSFFRRRAFEPWRVSLFAGLISGALLAALSHAGLSWNLDYGTHADLVPLAALVPLLLGAGLVMG